MATPKANPSAARREEDEHAQLIRELEEAEARKEQEWKKKGSALTWWIATPTALLALWAAGFLLTYQTPVSTPPADSATPASLPDAAVQNMDPTSLTPFATHETNAKPGESKIIDSSDINFAAQLMNFLHDPPKAGEPDKTNPADGTTDRGAP